MKIENEKEVDDKLRIVVKGIFELASSGDKDIVKVVQKDVKPDGSRLSEPSSGGRPRDAMFEAAYMAEVNNDKDMKEQVKRDMTDEEQSQMEDEVVDRFLRDFLNAAFRGL